MSGISLSVDPADLTRINQVLRNAIEGVTQPRLVMETIGDYLLSDTQLNFELQQTPQGKPWLASQRALVEGGKTLQDKGHLRDSYTYRAGDDFVEVGSNMIYAAIHHFGGETGSRAGRFEMEPRPALGITPVQVDEIEAIAADWAQEWFS